MMTEKERNSWVAILIAAAGIALMSLASCTRTVYVPQIKTEYVVQSRVDSLLLHDSVYVSEYIKGDTVRVVEYRYRDRFQTITRVDTVSRVDSVVVQLPVEVVHYEARMSTFQKLFFWLGLIAVAYLIVRVFFIRFG